MKNMYLDEKNHFIIVDGKRYRYNIVSKDVNGKLTYFCEENVIVKNGVVKKLDSLSKLLIDTYVLDLKEKTIKNLDKAHTQVFYKDSFIKSIGKIQDVQICEEQNGEKTIIIKPENGESIFVDINAHGEIESYVNANISSIDSYFLYRNTALKSLYVPNVNYIGDWFMPNNRGLNKLLVSKKIENQAVLSRFKSIIEFEDEHVI